MPASPCFASATIMSAAPARRLTVLALAKLLRELGETPVVLSRGYGGRAARARSGSILSRHAAADVGDEPLMLARTVAGGRSRAIASDGVALARSQGASVILMDDGFQNPAIAKDASLIVIDSERGIGNGLRVSRRSAARAAVAATCPHRRADRRRRAAAPPGRLPADDRRAGQAGAVGASRSRTRPRWRSCAASACWPLPASAIPRDSSGTLRASGIDVVRAARLRRSSSVFASRDRSPDRRGQARRADAGDDGKGSGAAARQRRRGKTSCRSAVTLEFDDARAVAEVRDRSAVQGAREEISVTRRVGKAKRAHHQTIARR